MKSSHVALLLPDRVQDNSPVERIEAKEIKNGFLRLSQRTSHFSMKIIYWYPPPQKLKKKKKIYIYKTPDNLIVLSIFFSLQWSVQFFFI